LNTARTTYDAKAHFGEIVRDAMAGRETIISYRGKPVAKVVPLHPVEPREETWPEREARLIREGIIIPARRKWDGEIPVSEREHPGALERFLADRD
jgi:prevent-host-death family protein